MRGATPYNNVFKTLHDISIHAPHARSDCPDGLQWVTCWYFNPRSSCEERQCRAPGPYCARRISIHAPHARSDASAFPPQPPDAYFNPRSSCEERPVVIIYTIDPLTISIHAPHARSDDHFSDELPYDADISIHAPHARSDIGKRKTMCDMAYFNPRSSCEERPGHWARPQRDAYFNPRSSCEERPEHRAVIDPHVDEFQSTLLMRGATIDRRIAATYGLFQSTLLMRGATCWSVQRKNALPISIHAPHARSDGLLKTCAPLVRVFQSTLLMRGATKVIRNIPTTQKFQSTLLMRGATAPALYKLLLSIRFQSTLLMRGATCNVSSAIQYICNFNPRSSCEERLQPLRRPR